MKSFLIAIACSFFFPMWATAKIQTFDAPTICAAAKLEIPEGWKVKSSRAGTNAPEGSEDRLKNLSWTWNLTPIVGKNFEVLITALPSDGRSAESNLQKLMAGMKGQTVENPLELKTDGEIAYFDATDPAPKPGEFKIMTLGSAKYGRHFLQFTAFYNVPGQLEKNLALGLVRSLRLVDVKTPGNFCTALLKASR